MQQQPLLFLPTSCRAVLLLLLVVVTPLSSSYPLAVSSHGRALRRDLQMNTTTTTATTTNATATYNTPTDALHLQLNNNNTWETNGTRYHEVQYFIDNRADKDICKLQVQVPAPSDPAARVFSSYGINWDQGGNHTMNTTVSERVSREDGNVMRGGLPSYMNSGLPHKARLTLGYITTGQDAPGPLKITNAQWC